MRKAKIPPQQRNASDHRRWDFDGRNLREKTHCQLLQRCQPIPIPSPPDTHQHPQHFPDISWMPEDTGGGPGATQEKTTTHEPAPDLRWKPSSTSSSGHTPLQVTYPLKTVKTIAAVPSPHHRTILVFHFISRGPAEGHSWVAWYAGVVRGIQGDRTGLG